MSNDWTIPMKNFLPESVKETTYANAVAEGYDIVQIKLKGEPCRIVIAKGEVRVYGYNDQPIKDFVITNQTACCVFLGAFFPGFYKSTMIFIIDCIEIGQIPEDYPHISWTSLFDFSYRDRFAFVKQQLSLMDVPFMKAVGNYPINTAADLWTKLDPEATCGVVYRQSKGKINAPVLVTRKYSEIIGGLP